MTTDIFIVSCLSHVPWLNYCLATLSRVSDIRRITVLLPEKDRGKYPIRFDPSLPLNVVYAAEEGNGHLWQQYAKCAAFNWSDADNILYLDSDHLIRRPMSPEFFMQDGKPVIPMLSYNLLQNAHIMPDGSTRPVPWQPVTQRLFEFDKSHRIEFEYMQRPGLLLPRWLLVEACDYLENRFLTTMKGFILHCKPIPPNWCGFSEFNFLGAYAHIFHPDKFVFRDLNMQPIGRDEWPIYQGWTHGSPDSEPYRSKIEEILK